MPSVLFMGFPPDPELDLYIEINELNDLVVNYATAKQYKNFECFNQKDIFINNILMTDIYIYLATLQTPS